MDGSNVPAKPAVADEEELAAWLNYAGESLLSRWEEMAERLRELAAASPTIEDEKTAERVTDNLRFVAALRDDLREFHKAEKAPFWRRGKQVDAWFNNIAKAMQDAAEPLRVALRDYALTRDTGIFAKSEPIQGHFGSATLRDDWDYVVEDITLVPAEFLLINDKAINEAKKERHPKTNAPLRHIAGIRWVRNRQLAVTS